MSEEVITIYKTLEQALSTPDRRFVLVGQARYGRNCPRCSRWMPKDAPIINYQRAKDKWVWVCLQCAPADPSFKTCAVKAVVAEFGWMLERRLAVTTTSGRRDVPPTLTVAARR
jgi:hypothetical protein